MDSSTGNMISRPEQIKHTAEEEAKIYVRVSEI